MNGKLSNASLVVVLLVAFSLFVAGLTNSTDGDLSVRGGPATPTPTRTPTPVNIGNFVWRDLNGNSIQDAGESGVQGITVQLWNASKTVVLDTDITNATGSYTVTSSGPGNYFIRTLLPSGLSMVTKNAAGSTTSNDSNGNSDGFTDLIEIASNVISTTTIDFGVRSPYPAYVALTPARLVDTRPSGTTVDGQNQVGLLTAGNTLTVPVTNRGGVPASSIAAVLNLTAVGPAGSGFLTVYPCDVDRPNASSLNTAGVTVANELVARLSQTGTVCIYSSVTTHVIIDVVGAYPR